jgi:hypothetical protein
VARCHTSRIINGSGPVNFPPIRRFRRSWRVWYARGDISLKEAGRKGHAAGMLYPNSGARVPVSTVHTWERVQGVLDGRFAKKAKRGRIAIRLARKRIQPAHIIAWSLWRRAHQPVAQRAHLKAKRQL